MTNREMFLLATTIIFASTTAGMALRSVMHHGHHGMMHPGMEMRGGPEGGPDADRAKFDFFAKADVNKDGFLTKDEMLAGQQARLDELFAIADTNHDGKLSKDEMEKGRDLMRAKMHARYEAERQGKAAAEATPNDAIPAGDQPTPAPAPAPVSPAAQ